MIILIDQDGPLADETTRLFEILQERYPDRPDIYARKRGVFTLRENFSEDFHEAIEDIRRSKNFYLSFQPVPGSTQAIKEMLELGHEVFICTSPLSHYEHCVVEKFQWVEKHLGEEFTRKIILAKDKTVVRGDILIDDRPEVTGAVIPEWEHILYNSTYNKGVTNKRRVDWENWREVLGL